MFAIHDRFTEEMRSRLETTCMGLGLVRLLQDARRFDEARMTLSFLEYGCQDVAEQPDKPDQEPGKTSNTTAGRAEASEMLPGSLSLA